MGTFPHQSWRVPVGASQAVPQSEILTVVVVEEEVMVSVVSWAIDDARQSSGDTIVTVVDGDGPDVNENVKSQVEHLVEGEEERVDVVGHSLQEAVHWMKSMTGKGSGDLPDVVWFVKQLLGDKRAVRSIKFNAR